MLPAIPLVVATFLLPESPRLVMLDHRRSLYELTPPRWYMMRGRYAEALQTLARLHSRGNENDALVQGEYLNMRAVIDEEANMNRSWGMVSSSDCRVKS